MTLNFKTCLTFKFNFLVFLILYLLFIFDKMPLWVCVYGKCEIPIIQVKQLLKISELSS